MPIERPLLFIFGLIASSVFGSVFLRVQRKKRMRALADRQGFAFMDNDLPGDFPVNILDDLTTWGDAHNVVYGSAGADRLIAFDGKVGLGRQQRIFTVVGRHNLHPVEHGPRLRKGLQLRSSGAWQVITFDHLLWGGGAKIKPTDIERLWSELT